MKKVIISGGGTGGHVFPAIAIAMALKEKIPDIDILFVGAKGKIEMEKVPEAGFKIIGLSISGFQRKLSMKNLVVVFKLMKALVKSRMILSSFKPDVVIGVGGYASGPVLRVAASMGIPTLIQEQNSFPGITNRLLAKSASTICVAYEGLEKFFPKEKIVLTGNPVRDTILNSKSNRDAAFMHFGIDNTKKIILVLGGSGGAKQINESITCSLKRIALNRNVQVIWQTGRAYFDYANIYLSKFGAINVFPFEFISRMDLAYLAADVIISRAGAMTISELCIVGKPAILVPSPNVTEDHQTKNAMSLVDKSAAFLISDTDAKEKVIGLALELLANDEISVRLRENILKMGIRDAASRIANEAIKLFK